MQHEDFDRDTTRSPNYPFPRDLTLDTEKATLRKWAKGRKNLVEIGVFEGASAVQFRSAMHHEGTLHLIDPFIPDSLNPYLIARRDFAVYNVNRVRNGSVEFYEDFSYCVAETWDRPIDLLFIDGDHRKEACLRDWTDWSRFVEPGGVVLFHDARCGKGDGGEWDGFPGPTEVVNRLFRGPNRLPDWEIVDEVGTLVVVQRAAA